MTNLQTIWQEAWQLGLDKSRDPNRFTFWDTHCINYDNTEILGTWIEPPARQLKHMKIANQQLNKFPQTSLDYIAWYTNSQVNRVRTTVQQGGEGKPVTACSLAEIAYNLGAIAGIRGGDEPPPYTNYVKLNTED